MPEEYLSGIEQIAKLTGLKKSDVTRMAIRKFIEEYEGEKEINHYGRAKNLIGVVESGISDLGQNHRNYLIRIIKLTDEVKRLNQKSELLSERTISIDKRVVRLETIIEIAEKQAYLPKE
jgi:hypothetical protein